MYDSIYVKCPGLQEEQIQKGGEWLLGACGWGVIKGMYGVYKVMKALRLNMVHKPMKMVKTTDLYTKWVNPYVSYSSMLHSQVAL